MLNILSLFRFSDTMLSYNADIVEVNIEGLWHFVIVHLAVIVRPFPFVITQGQGDVGWLNERQAALFARSFYH